jgi:hypothetical protein
MSTGGPQGGQSRGSNDPTRMFVMPDSECRRASPRPGLQRAWPGPGPRTELAHLSKAGSSAGGAAIAVDWPNWAQWAGGDAAQTASMRLRPEKLAARNEEEALAVTLNVRDR